MEWPTLSGRRILIVHYGEHTPLDDEYRATRMGRLARELTEAGALVTRYAPTFSMFTGAQRPVEWSGRTTNEGTVCMIPTRAFPPSSVTLARVGFLSDFARGVGARVRCDPPYDAAIVGYPPPGVLTAVRRAAGRSLPILADIRDLWPDAIAPSGRAGAATAAKAVGMTLAQELRLADSVVAMSPVMLHRAPRSRRNRAITLGLQANDGGPAGPGFTQPAGRSDTAAWRAVFVGSFAQLFDFTSMLGGWKQFIDGTPQPRPTLEIFGRGERAAEIAELTRGAANVVYGGWLPGPDVPARLDSADVGIAPTRPGVGTTLSNKVLEYLSSGLFVLHSLEKPIASELDVGSLGRKVPSHPAGWAAAFQWVHDHRDAVIGARRVRLALALRRYGSGAVRDQWFTELDALIDGSARS